MTTQKPTTPTVQSELLIAGKSPSGRALVLTRIANEAVGATKPVSDDPELFAESEKLVSSLGLFQVVIADEAAASFAQRWNESHDAVEAREGCKLPPFAQTWFEYDWPSPGASGKILRLGFACITYAPDEDGTREVGIIAASSYPGQPVVFPAWIFFYHVKRDGTFNDDRMRADYFMPQGSITDAHDFTKPLWATLAFLNCKNVTLDPHHFEPKTQKRLMKRFSTDEPVYRCHTLRLHPPGYRRRTIITDGSEIHEPAYSLAFHMRRGHVKHYVESRPRFGRKGEFGDFWTSSVAVGDRKRGVITKDYAVAAPAGGGK